MATHDPGTRSIPHQRWRITRVNSRGSAEPRDQLVGHDLACLESLIRRVNNESKKTIRHPMQHTDSAYVSSLTQGNSMNARLRQVNITICWLVYCFGPETDRRCAGLMLAVSKSTVCSVLWPLSLQRVIANRSIDSTDPAASELIRNLTFPSSIFGLDRFYFSSFTSLLPATVCPSWRHKYGVVVTFGSYNWLTFYIRSTAYVACRGELNAALHSQRTQWRSDDVTRLVASIVDDKSSSNCIGSPPCRCRRWTNFPWQIHIWLAAHDGTSRFLRSAALGI